MPRRTPALPAWCAVLGLLASCAVALVAAAPPAAAEEVVERPASGVFAVEGHGWGHGRGMSQWGAQGAASLGVSAEQIVRTYYPGTARAVLPAAPIRVLLSGDEGRDTDVFAAAGPDRHRQRHRRDASALPAGPSRWRVTVDAAGLHLQARTGATWTPYALAGRTTLAGPVRFGGPTVVRVAYASGTSRDYRGTVSAVRASATALQTVVVLPLEDYLLGVVPRESSASWRPAALQAQAIAARSYSAYKRARVGGRGTLRHLRHHGLPGLRRHRRLQRRRRPHLPRAGDDDRRRPGDRGRRAHLRRRADLRGVQQQQRRLVDERRLPLPAGGPGRLGRRPAQHRSTRGRPRCGRPTSSGASRRVGTLQRIRVTARDGNGAWGGRVRTVVLEGVSRTGRADPRDHHRRRHLRRPPLARPPPTACARPGGASSRPRGPRRPARRPAGTRRPARARRPAARPRAGAGDRQRAGRRVPPAGARPRARPLDRHADRDVPQHRLDAVAGRRAAAGPHGAARAPRPARGARGVDPARRAAQRRDGGRARRDRVAVAGARRRPRVPAGRHARAYRLRLGTGAAFGASVLWQVPVQDARPGTRRARSLRG